MIRHYVLKSAILSTLKSCIRVMIYQLSEFEVSVQSPGQPTPLRRLYLRMEGLQFGKHSHFSRSLIIYKGQNISIGERASIGECSKLHAHTDIVIGDDFLAAPGLTINSGGHDVVSLVPYAKKVVIGHRVWCGTNVTILPGVSIGNDVVLGAGSLINKDIPSNVVAAGNPARIIRKLDRSSADVWKWGDSK